MTNLLIENSTDQEIKLSVPEFVLMSGTLRNLLGDLRKSLGGFV